MLQTSRRHEGGFTMVELMVVVGIISVLALIAIPMYLNQRRTAVDASVKTDVSNAAATVDVWVAENPSVAVPSLTISRADSSQSNISFSAPAPAPISNIKVGARTSITIAPAPTPSPAGAYTITGTNINGNESASGIVWDSYTTGGLK